MNQREKSSDKDPINQVNPYTELTTPAALFQCDGGLILRAASPAMAQMLGVERPTDLVGVALADLFSDPTVFAQFKKELSAYTTGEQPNPFQTEVALKTRRKETRWVHLTALVHPPEDDIYLEACILDLSARQNELQALRTSELQLRLLVQNAQDIIFNIDTATTRITSLNPAFEKVTGWTPGEWVGKSFAPLVHPDDLAYALNIIQNAVQGDITSTFELRIRARSGGYITVEFSTALRQKNGEVTHWFGIARDITSRKQADAATKRYLQRLQTLHKIDRAVLLVQSPEEVAFVSLSHLTNLVSCDYASIMILDFDADEAEIVTEYRDGQLLLGQAEHLHISSLDLPPSLLHGQSSHISNLEIRSQPGRRPDNAGAEPDPDDPGQDPRLLRFARHSIDQQEMRTVLNLPLLSRDVMVGVLTLAAYRPRAFSDESVEVAGEVANQLAVSLHGMQLLKAEERARHTAETLSAASMALTQILQEDLMVERLLDYLRRLVPYDRAGVYLLEDETLRLSAVRPASGQSPGSELHMSDYPGLAVLSEREGGVVIDDLAAIQPEQRGQAHSEGKHSGGKSGDKFWPNSPGMRSWLGVPLTNQGHMMGLYVIEHASPRFFLDHHMRAAEALAAQTAIALTNAQLLAERQKYAAQLEDRVAERTAALSRSNGLIAALSQVATRVQSSLDPQRAIETLGDELKNLLGVSSMVALLDEESQALNIRYYTQDDRTREILKQITLSGPGGPQLKREHWPLFTDLVDQNRILFLPDAMLRAYDAFFEQDDSDIMPLLAASGITQDIKSIFLPLMMEDRVLGVLLLWGKSLQEIDIPAIKIFAGQIAAALEMGRLHAQLQIRRVAEQQALLRLSQALLGQVDVEATSQRALEIVADTFRPDLAAIMLMEADGRYVCMSAGLGWDPDITGERFSLTDDSIIAFVLQGQDGNRPAVVADIKSEDRFTIPEPVAKQGVISGISAPMSAGSDRLGVLSIYWKHQRPISDDESRLLTLIGNTTAQSIARARLYEAEQQARHVADTLRTANMTLTQSLDMVTVVETLLETLQEIIPYDTSNVMMLDDDHRLTLYAHRGYEAWAEIDDLADPSFDLHELPLVARCVETRRGQIISDTREEADWVWTELGRHIRSWLCIPLIAGGEVVGIYSLDKAEPDFFTEMHLQWAESLGAQAASAIQNARLFNEVTASQDRLRTLTRRLVDIQETERSRVAKSLHEGVGQYLTGLSLRLKASTQAQPTMLIRQLNDVRAIVDELTTQVRELSLALRPTLLDDMGLQPALDWLFERYEKQTRLKLDFVHRDIQGRRLAAPVETAAFRVLQEILTDLEEYHRQDPLGLSAPISTDDQAHLRVRVWTDEQALHLSVIDPKASIGLSESLNNNNADNLNNLKERISLLDGDLMLENLPDGGTRVSAFLPLGIRRDTEG